MEPTTTILLGVSAVLLAVGPNVVLLLSLKRRRMADLRLTELMDRLSSSHEALEALLLETGTKETDGQEFEDGVQHSGRDLATARPAPTSDDDRFEQSASSVTSVGSASSGGQLPSATCAGSEAVERSVESLVKAIADRAQRQQAQATAAAACSVKGERKSPAGLKRVRSRLQWRLGKRAVLVLVPAAAATAIALFVVRPDSMGSVSVSTSAAMAQSQPSGSAAKPVVPVGVEAAKSPQGTPSVDPHAAGAGNEVSDVPESLSIAPAGNLGSSRRAAELFPELTEGTVSEIAVLPEAVAPAQVSTVTEAPATTGKDHTGSAIPPPGHSGPSATDDDEASSLASAMRSPAVPRRGQSVAPRQVEPAVPRAAQPAATRRVESTEPSSRRVARTQMVPLAGATRGRPSPSRGTAASSRMEYNRGVDLFSAHRYREAIELFRSLISSDLHTSLLDNCYYWIGESYFAIREFGEARNCFEKVLKMRGTNKAQDSRMGLAYCLLELGDTGRAIEELSRVARTSPDANQAMRARDLASHLKQASDVSDMSGREVGSAPASPMQIP